MDIISTPVIKKLYPWWYLKKLVSITKYFHHGHRSLVYFCSLTPEIPYWEFYDGYVMPGFSRAHLNWPGFVELLNFLSPTTISNEIKYAYPWTKMTKFMTSHRRMPSKIKAHLLICCLNTTNDGAKLDLLRRKKSSSLSMVWCHGYRDYWGFSKRSLWILIKKRFHFNQVITSKKPMLIESC